MSLSWTVEVERALTDLGQNLVGDRFESLGKSLSLSFLFPEMVIIIPDFASFPNWLGLNEPADEGVICEQ